MVEILRSLAISYTWSSNFILPYESEFNIRDKFCFLNATTWNRYCKVKKEGKVDFKNKNGNIFINGRIIPLHKKIRYCPVCIKYGYHSTLHQLFMFRHCFLHPGQILRDGKSMFYVGYADSMDRYELFSGYNVKIEDISDSPLIPLLQGFMERNINLQYIYFMDVTFGNKHMESVYPSTSLLMEKILNMHKRTADDDEIRLLASIPESDIMEENSLLTVRRIEELSSYQKRFKKYYIQPLEPAEYLNWYYDIDEEGFYIPKSRDSSPILFHWLTYEIIETIFNGDLSLYYSCASKLSSHEQSARYRKEEYIEQYAALLVLYSIIQADRPELFQKLYNYWIDAKGFMGTNTHLAYELSEINHIIGIENKMHSLTHKRNEFTIFKDMILRDSFYFAKDLLYQAFKDGYDDFRNSKLVSLNLTILMPQYIIVKYSGIWNLYSCRFTMDLNSLNHK